MREEGLMEKFHMSRPRKVAPIQYNTHDTGKSLAGTGSTYGIEGIERRAISAPGTEAISVMNSPFHRFSGSVLAVAGLGGISQSDRPSKEAITSPSRPCHGAPMKTSALTLPPPEQHFSQSTEMTTQSFATGLFLKTV
jgi:hypothetical protein